MFHFYIIYIVYACSRILYMYDTAADNNNSNNLYPFFIQSGGGDEYRWGKPWIIEELSSKGSEAKRAMARAGHIALGMINAVTLFLSSLFLSSYIYFAKNNNIHRSI